MQFRLTIIFTDGHTVEGIFPDIDGALQRLHRARQQSAPGEPLTVIIQQTS